MSEELLTMRALSLGDMKPLTEWRRASRPFLRTPQELTVEQQEKFYNSVLMDRSCPHRYFAFDAKLSIRNAGQTVGVGGLTNIQWENGLTEIALISDPRETGKGYGRDMVGQLLAVAFNQFRLQTVIAECYNHNPVLGFWHHMAEVFNAMPPVTLPRRKFWDGRLIDATLFTWTAAEWPRA